MKLITCSVFLLILAASLSWGQYSTTYTRGVTDLTSHCTNATNCWKVLPTKAFVGVSGGSDGSLYFRDSGNAVWLYNMTNRTYTKQTAMGASVQKLVVASASQIWSLQTTSYCSPQLLGIFHWTGSAWHQPNANACAADLAVSDDGTLLDVAYGNIWESIDSGGTWAERYSGGGWAHVAVVSSADAVAATSGGVVWDLPLPTGTATKLGVSSGVVQIAIDNIGDVFGPVVVNTQGSVYNFNYSTGKWKQLYGLSASAITSISKAMTVALNASGQPYHYNVYGAFISGGTAGSVGVCPGEPFGECPPGVTHTAHLTVGFPHGVYGVMGTASGSPTTYINATSWDASPQCDPLLGDPGDPECQPVASGNVICSASGYNYGSPQQPPPPPEILTANSMNSWDGTITEVSSYSIGIGYVGIAVCGASDNTCAPGTTPTCPISALEWHEAVIGPDATPQLAEEIAKAQCPIGGYPYGWHTISEYEAPIPPALPDPSTCAQVRVLKFALADEIPCN